MLNCFFKKQITVLKFRSNNYVLHQQHFGDSFKKTAMECIRITFAIFDNQSQNLKEGISSVT
jgi:hypothetical protein